jgi:hypothetical protein
MSAINRLVNKCEMTGAIFIKMEDADDKQKRIKTAEYSEYLAETDTHSIRHLFKAPSLRRISLQN